MLDWGCFGTQGHDDYGNSMRCLGEEDIGGINGMEFDNKWPDVTEEVLVRELNSFLAQVKKRG